MTDSLLFTQDDVELVQDVGQFCLNVGRVVELKELASLRDRLQQWIDQQAQNEAFQRGLETGDFKEWDRMIGVIDETDLTEG